MIKVPIIVNPTKDIAFDKATFSPSVSFKNTNLVRKVSSIGPQKAKPILEKNVIVKIHASLSKLTPKYFAVKGNVTIDKDILNNFKIKRYNVTLLTCLFFIQQPTRRLNFIT